jgi:DNA-binding response OmpR family regulator
MSTILVIDDDRIFRRLLVDALEKRGHRVLQAGRGSEADVVLDAEKPDLLLVDGLLPDTTGIQWLEKQRSVGRAMPVLFVTSFFKSMRDFERVTKALGKIQLLRKPVPPDLVVDRVDAILAG